MLLDTASAGMRFVLFACWANKMHSFVFAVVPFGYGLSPMALQLRLRLRDLLSDFLEALAGEGDDSGFPQKSLQRGLVEMITANFLAFSYQDRDEFVVARPELLVPVDIHDIETKGQPRLEFLQGGYHFMAQVAVLASVESKQGAIGRHRTICCPCCLCCRHSFSS
jgi:hypothetical protein